MKKALLIILLAGSQLFMFSQEPLPPTCNYDGNDPIDCTVPVPHSKPTEYCTPHNRPDGKKPCECLHNSPNGCKAGKMDTEMKNCNSWCWKDMCHCCQS